MMKTPVDIGDKVQLISDGLVMMVTNIAGAEPEAGVTGYAVCSWEDYDGNKHDDNFSFDQLRKL